MCNCGERSRIQLLSVFDGAMGFELLPGSIYGDESGLGTVMIDALKEANWRIRRVNNGQRRKGAMFRIRGWRKSGKAVSDRSGFYTSPCRRHHLVANFFCPRMRLLMKRESANPFAKRRAEIFEFTLDQRLDAKIAMAVLTGSGLSLTQAAKIAVEFHGIRASGRTHLWLHRGGDDRDIDHEANPV